MKNDITRQNTRFASLSESDSESVGVLEHMREKLSLAGYELQRLEYEGGKPMNQKQAAEIDVYFKISQLIENALIQAHF